MKKALAFMLVLVCLAGCGSGERDLKRGMALREKLLSSSGCSFDAGICADYGDKYYTFAMHCQGDADGGINFEVTEPQSISGICGNISRDKGKLTFDETALAFPLLADGQIAPVAAPWIFLKTLRSGYLTSAGMEGELLRLSIDDSYREDALHLDIWLNDRDEPIRCDILYAERRILSLDVENFTIL